MPLAARLTWPGPRLCGVPDGSLEALRPRISAGLPLFAEMPRKEGGRVTHYCAAWLLPLAAQPACHVTDGLSLVALRPRLSTGLPLFKGFVVARYIA
jgi:hypothetical protein